MRRNWYIGYLSSREVPRHSSHYAVPEPFPEPKSSFQQVLFIHVTHLVRPAILIGRIQLGPARCPTHLTGRYEPINFYRRTAGS
jgi:hypothetical protein